MLNWQHAGHRARRYRVPAVALIDLLVASRSDDHHGPSCLRWRPRPLAIARGADATGDLATSRGRRGPGPVRQWLRRPGRPRPCDGDGAARLVGIEHPGVVPAAARPPRRRAVLGRPRVCARRIRRRGGRRRTDRTGRRRPRHRPLRAVRHGCCSGPARRSGDGSPGRLPVRCGWVSAELAMVTGDGAAAVGHAERAVELAASTDSVRHAVKSDVVLAAALCSAGMHEESRRVADAALTAAERLGFVPLTWALACLLADVGSAVHSPHRIAEIRRRVRRYGTSSEEACGPSR